MDGSITARGPPPGRVAVIDHCDDEATRSCFIVTLIETADGDQFSALPVRLASARSRNVASVATSGTRPSISRLTSRARPRRRVRAATTTSSIAQTLRSGWEEPL